MRESDRVIKTYRPHVESVFELGIEAGTCREDPALLVGLRTRVGAFEPNRPEFQSIGAQQCSTSQQSDLEQPL